ncbi:MAG: SdiA-regulated domain-containing protein [Gemmatimonadales bacterium]
MRLTRLGAGLLLALLGGCGRGAGAAAGDSTLLTSRRARLDSALADSSGSPDKPIALWIMPEQLKELSGLALTSDGRLLAHGDEHGEVFELDFRRGLVVKKFSVGTPRVMGDFESITTIGDTVALLTSDGKLFRFLEGANKSAVPFTMTNTGLGSECEFEAMTYDAAHRTLLLACKTVHDKSLRDAVVIFRVPVDSIGDAAPQIANALRIPMADVTASTDWKTFRPSDIAIDPVSGNYVILGSIEKGMLEVTPAGAVVSVRDLPKGHEQAEGLAITRDHILIIGDEAKQDAARLTLYRRP